MHALVVVSCVPQTQYVGSAGAPIMRFSDWRRAGAGALQVRHSPPKPVGRPPSNRQERRRFGQCPRIGSTPTPILLVEWNH